MLNVLHFKYCTGRVRIPVYFFERLVSVCNLCYTGFLQDSNFCCEKSTKAHCANFQADDDWDDGGKIGFWIDKVPEVKKSKLSKLNKEFEVSENVREHRAINGDSCSSQDEHWNTILCNSEAVSFNTCTMRRWCRTKLWWKQEHWPCNAAHDLNSRKITVFISAVTKPHCHDFHLW